MKKLPNPRMLMIPLSRQLATEGSERDITELVFNRYTSERAARLWNRGLSRGRRWARKLLGYRYTVQYVRGHTT